MSGNEPKAFDLIAKCRFIWKNLPDFLRPDLIHEGRGWLEFAGKDSEIRALASTERAGAGTDATIVVRDELREHPCGHANFVAISPTIDSGDAQIIDISTYDKTTPYDDNHFAQRVDKARKGTTQQLLEPYFEFYDGVEHAKLVFLGWKLRPTRKEGISVEEWYDLVVVPKYSEQDREQEYPLTLEESISPPKSTAYFDTQSVNRMYSYIYPPLEEEDLIGVRTWNGIVRIWKTPIPGRHYLVFTDPADGFDPFAVVVMDASSGEWVAVADGTMRADDVAVIHDYLVRYYNDASNAWEDNGRAGGRFGKTIDELNTPSQAPRRDPRGEVVEIKEEVVYGWWLSSEHRRIMLDEYETIVRHNDVVIHYRPAIEQFRSFTRDKTGKLRASTGHDDFVMAGAGVNLLRKYHPLPDEISLKTFFPRNK